MSFRTIEWTGEKLILIDQTKLPVEETYVDYTDYREVAVAIKTMVVRGAPAIGVTAAFGVVLAAKELLALKAVKTGGDFAAGLEVAFATLAATRPTAVNLFWAIKRMRGVVEANEGLTPAKIYKALERQSRIVYDEDIAANRAMGRFGAGLIAGDECTILTHCNAGALATAGYGTALGVIRACVEAGKKVTVFADETRPLLQGARLTAWELHTDGIDVTLICDNMAGALMRQRKIDAVVVGADRIAANGDAANKIGTYPLSLVAREHGVPFYVAAPLSTIDFELSDGSAIPIEERDAVEVTHPGGVAGAPEGIKVWNPAFDVTPAGNIAAIITERGVARAPYGAALAALRVK
jgi:methylthioribose-1-phosphate isomerase